MNISSFKVTYIFSALVFSVYVAALQSGHTAFSGFLLPCGLDLEVESSFEKLSSGGYWLPHGEICLLTILTERDRACILYMCIWPFCLSPTFWPCTLILTWPFLRKELNLCYNIWNKRNRAFNLQNLGWGRGYNSFYADSFTTSITISISILQTFRSWVATSHLRPPMAFISYITTRPIHQGLLLIWMFYSEGDATFQ